jgi:hypothetical protein
MSLKNLTIERLAELVKESTSTLQIAVKLGYGKRGGSTVTRLKKMILDNHLDTKHFTGQAWSRGKSSYEDDRVQGTAKSIEDVFCENSRVAPSQVKKIIRKKNVLPDMCAICGIPPEWNGKPLVLQMDHINGIRNDHRLENLRMVCANCHSQTDTYCAKNKKRRQPTLEEIIQALRETENVKQAIDLLGINNSNRKKLTKIIKDYNIEQKTKEVVKLCESCNQEILTRSDRFCSQKCSVIVRTAMTSDPSTWIHGNTNTYEYRKCRCDLCRKANTDKKRNENLQRKLKKLDLPSNKG